MSVLEKRDANPIKSSSHEVPAGCDFQSFNLGPETIKTLLRNGIKYLFPIQKATFGAIAAGKDVIGKDRTGSGKTLAFALPVLEKMRARNMFRQSPGQRPFKIVIVPTRELALQVSSEYEKLKNYENEYRVATIYGGSDIQAQISKL